MTIKELLEDLLIEFDELDMQPMTIVPNPRERAEAWKHELEYALKHLKAEVAREIFQELIEKIELISVVAEPKDGFTMGVIKTFNKVSATITELKNKYIGEQNDGRN